VERTGAAAGFASEAQPVTAMAATPIARAQPRELMEKRILCSNKEKE
jgi:hypothetical protein